MISTRTVRCLPLWQPWASLMACGAKFLETRGRNTHVRGEIYIHAAATYKGIASLYDADAAVIEAMEEALGLKIGRWRDELPFGALIARGRLTASMPIEQAAIRYPDQIPFGNFSPGRFGHLYEDLASINPIPRKGLQGFFFTDIPDEPMPFRLDS